eukprot:gnl/MRDRNA2_/MRDRNA2_92676_c0_seq1.p1 gnl/MRDRNA2_/MRDRNA2_92676_c0~~gnl/MRDRNA2_/MRDRNA2_92676_c0_seq1.p1  ORF type:complete len:111 (+),score=26.29 gnl/MRDRNA2_/MRDRNA2_92676_c0_seq1:68-400(+)
MRTLFCAVLLLASVTDARKLLRNHKKDVCSRFYPTVKDACGMCKKNKAPTCTCMVGDCSEEMKKASGDECGGGKPYYCAVCGPLEFDTADGKIKTTDYPKEKEWADVHPC